jgi:predicted nuclease of predicted toxin-antitoxin system
VNLVADECCDALLVDALRMDGRDVLYVKETAPGSDENAVLHMAARQQRLLLIEDKDFGELVVRLQMPTHGIVLLRLNPADTSVKITRLRDLFTHHSHRLAGSMTVLDENKARFRPL